MPISDENFAKLKQIMADGGGLSAPSEQMADTAGARFQRAFIESESMLDNVGNYLSSEYPGAFGGKFFIGSEKFGTGYRSAREIHGEFYDSLRPQDRREYLARGNDYRFGVWNDKTEKETVQQFYANVGTEGFAAGAGDIAGMLASPETLLLPGAGIGAGFTRAAVTGAVAAGLHGASEGLAQKGEVDPLETSKYAAGGAVGGALFKGAEKLVSPYLIQAKNKIKDELGSAWFDKAASNTEVMENVVIKGDLDDATKKWLKDNTETGFDPKDKPKFTIDPDTGKPRLKLTVPKEGVPAGKPRVKLKSEEQRAKYQDQMEAEDRLAVEAFDKTYPEGSALSAKLVADLRAESLDDAKDKITSGNVPHTSPLADKLSTPTGRISEMDKQTGWQKLSASWSSGGLVTQPYRVANTMGYYGKAFNELLSSAQENSNKIVADGLADYNKAFRGLNTSEKEVADFMRKIPGAVSKDTEKAAESVRKILDRQLAGAVKMGVLTRQKATELMKNADEKGYFPRVYDRQFLMSNKGEKLFIERLGEKEFANAHALEQAVKGILGEVSPALAAQIKGKKTINPTLARRIYQETNKSVYSNKSRHLENERVFDEDLEDVLSAFTIDPKASLLSYLQDTASRIEMARNFGAKGEVFNKINAKLASQGYDSSKVEMIEQVYFGATRDAKSKALETFLNKPRWMMKGVSTFTNLTNYKLMFAPIYNVGQSTINGSTQAARLRGAVSPAKAYVTSMQGIINGARRTLPGANKELTDELDRMGGAVATTIMSTIGEGMAEAAMSGTARKLGPLNPKWWANSSNFLKAVGYIDTEVFNRRAGMSIGKSLVQLNIDKKMALQAKNILSPADKRKLSAADDMLNELGIDITMPARDVAIRDIDLAAQRFSDKMNFINAAQTLPLGWQTIHGRMLSKFKSFVLNQTTFMKVNVMEPMKKGDFLPAITYFGVGTPVGMTLSEFRRMVMADDEHYSGTQKVAMGMLAFAGLGIWTDMIRQSLRSKTGPLELLAGPIVSDFAGIAHAGAKTAVSPLTQDGFDWSPLKKQAISQFPFPGKTGYQKDLKNEKNKWQKDFNDYQSPFQKFTDQLLGL